MKRIWRRLLVLFGIFILAAAAFTLHLYIQSEKGTSEPEVEYRPMEAASFPLICSQVGSRDISPMHGYSTQRNLESAETPVVIASGRSLRLKVESYGTGVKQVAWSMRGRGQDEEFSQGVITSLQGNTLNITMDHDMEKNRDYFLNLVLQTEDDREIYYYGRVRNADEVPAEAMLDYVMDFHNAGYDLQRAEQYAATLETDRNPDTSTLADVTIHSTVGQLAWGNIQPSENASSLSITILEMDNNFASLVLNYLVSAGGEELDQYMVEEYYSVHCTSLGYYLMDFKRSVTQLFSSHTARVDGNNLDFGVVSEGKVEVLRSEDAGVTAFSVGGEVWSFQPEGRILTKIFSFLDMEDLLRTIYPKHEIKLLDINKTGEISFLLYGYMNRGTNEGSVGVACMRYNPDTNALSELFFLPYAGDFEYLKEGIDTLACMGSNGQVYLMVGDTVYTVEDQGQGAIMLANRVHDRNLVVNSEQTAIAWQLDPQVTATASEASQTEDAKDETAAAAPTSDLRMEEYGQTMSNRVQLLFLDTGEEQVLEVEAGDWIAPHGFIEDDCILAQGHVGDLAEANSELIHPFHTLEIVNRRGKVEARYSYDSIYIASVTVTPGQVELTRLQKGNDGVFRPISNDTLIQNEVVKEKDILLRTCMDDTRRTIYVLDAATPVENGEDLAPLSYVITENMSYNPANALHLAAVEDESSGMKYYAYSGGKLQTVEDQAGPAIRAAYEGMGIVFDSRGRVVWYRTGRDLGRSISTPAMEPVMLSQSTDICLTMIAKMAGMDASPQDIAGAASVTEAMETFLPGRSLNLTGAPVRALLYYLNMGAPILVVPADGHALVLCGFDQYNVTFYDPVEGSSTKMGQQDAGEFLADGCSLLGYIPR